VAVDLQAQRYDGADAIEALATEWLRPARDAGRRVWLGGLSLGGWQAVLCARRHPGLLDGLCLLAPYVCARIAGLDVGYAVGLYAGSQTISASIGVATDQINRLGLSPEQAKTYLDAIPVGYAVTYIFGTIGSAIVLAQFGPRLIRVDLAAACAEYEKTMGGGQTAHDPGVFSAYRQIEVRAYRVTAASGLTGKPVRDLFPGLRIFVERIHRGARILDADGHSTLEPGDVVAISGPRSALVENVGITSTLRFVEGNLGSADIETSYGDLAVRLVRTTA